MKRSTLISIIVAGSVLFLVLCFVIGFSVGSNRTDGSHVHSYSEKVTSPTCTEQGYTTYTCKCGHSYKEHVDALDHDFGSSSIVGDKSCTKRMLYESRCNRCAESYQYTASPIGHSYSEISSDGLTITYRCDKCSDIIAIDTDESILDYSSSYELFDVDPTFSFDIVTEYDAPEIMNRLDIVDSYFFGSEYEDMASVKYILTSKGAGVWNISTPNGYEYSTTYIVSLPAGIKFKDYIGEELIFTTKNDPNHENKVVYKDDIVFLRNLENSNAGYYPYEINDAGEYLYLTVGKVDGISRGQVLCVGEITSFDDITSETECYYGVVEDYYKTGNGRWIVKLSEPELEDIFEELDVVYDGDFNFEDEDIDIEQLKADIIDSLYANKEFVEFLSVSKVASARSLAARDLHSPELANAHLFLGGVEIEPNVSFSGNNIYIDINGSITLTIRNSVNKKLGTMTIAFNLDTQSSFKFDAGYQMRKFLGINTGVKKINIQVTQTDVTNFDFDVSVDVEDADLFNGYVLNTQTGEAHLACCVEVTRSHNPSAFKSITAAEVYTSNLKCPRCKPENGDSLEDSFNGYYLDTLYCSDWESVATDIKKLTEIEYNDRLEADTTMYKTVIPVCGPVAIIFEVKFSLGLNIDAIVDYSSIHKQTTIYGMRLNNGDHTEVFKQAIDAFAEQKEISALGSVEIKAGLVVDAQISVVGLERWINAGVSANVGAYTKLSGVADTENALLGAYFEAGLYLEIGMYNKVIFWHESQKFKSEELPIIKYGSDKLFFAYDTYYDKISLVDSYDILANDLLVVRYFNLKTMNVGTSELSLDENSKYKVNISLADGTYCDIKNGKIVVKPDAPETFIDRIIITVEADNNWDTYKNGSAVYYLGTYEIELFYSRIHDHIESAWIIDKQPTETETGIKHTECTICGEWMSTGEISPLGDYSKGLEYTLNPDGQSYSVSDIGACTDTEIIIPKTHNGLPVTSIERNAFYACSSLWGISIPESVKDIGGAAFSGCTSLTSITIPDSVTSIGRYAFHSCSSLKSVTIPRSVTSIDYQAFYGCSSLTSINVDINNQHYKSIDGNLYTKDGKTLIQYAIGKKGTDFVIPASVTKIRDSAFSGCTALSNVAIGNSVTLIEAYAFSGCTSLTSVNIPNSVTYIGSGVFSDCTALSNVAIGSSVTFIGDYAFSGCAALTSISIPNSVTSIPASVFSGCTQLESINIPESVTMIGYEAFYGCNLTSINYNGTIDEWNAVYKHQRWDYKTDSYTIYCANGQISKNGTVTYK